MRFPFTLMGLVALLFAGWIVVLYTHRQVGALELAVAAVMVGFGVYVLYRRVRFGRQG